ncbi:unnamed protein product [Cladocopium goreaui]|uniref:Uncharacterized protein n=1 Tax=Cladocopium goreaui TaxID=2562237 RepID=A0A9P1C414_9DINO|nr:unnamed protein product [Cladocopium goreaui]
MLGHLRQRNHGEPSWNIGAFLCQCADADPTMWRGSHLPVSAVAPVLPRGQPGSQQWNHQSKSLALEVESCPRHKRRAGWKTRAVLELQTLRRRRALPLWIEQIEQIQLQKIEIEWRRTWSQRLLPPCEERSMYCDCRCKH